MRDLASNTATASVTILFTPPDTMQPTITITAPLPLAAFNRTSIAVSGTVGADAMAVYCNEAVAGLTNDGFGATVTLKEGPNNHHLRGTECRRTGRYSEHHSHARYPTAAREHPNAAHQCDADDLASDGDWHYQ